MLDFSLSSLEQRAKALLINPESVSQQALKWAYEETLEFAHLKDAPGYALNDFAFMRLKRILKVPFSDEDALIYENARKAIVNAPSLVVAKKPPLRPIRLRSFEL